MSNREEYLRPCLYNLGWNARKTAIRFDIANLAIKELLSAKGVADRFDSYYETFKENGWELDKNPGMENGKWGFGGILEPAASKDQLYSSYDIRIPGVLMRAKNGSETNEKSWKGIFNISSTLSILFSEMGRFAKKLNIAIKRDKSLPEKLLEIDSLSINPAGSFYASAFGALIYRQAYPWLLQNRGKYIESVSKATKKAHDKMTGQAEDLRYFPTGINDDGHLIITCPGDACDIGMYPDRFFGFESVFEEIHPHNTDTPIQQLTLLVGLAAMCDEIRKFNSKK